MKRLKCMLLIDGSDSLVTTSFVPVELRSKIPCNWRDVARNNADSLQLTLQESDLESLESALNLDLKTLSPEREYVVRDLNLPGGILIVYKRVGDALQPLYLVWEEEVEPVPGAEV